MQSAGLERVEDLTGLDNRHNRVYLTEVCLKQALAGFTARKIEDPFALEVAVVHLRQRFGNAFRN